MTPRDETVDPAMRRELEALEAALSGEPVEPDLADLAQIARDLRDLREAPDERFAAELDRRAAAGFGRGGASLRERATSRLRSLEPRRALLPALATATSVVVVAAGVTVALRQDNAADPVATLDRGEAQPLKGGDVRTLEEMGDGAAAPVFGPRSKPLDASPNSAAQSGPTVPTSGASAPREANRQVERSAELTLGTEPEGVQDVASEVLRVVGRQRGIVLSSSVRDGAEGQAGADFALLVPTARLGAALADLSALAEVRSRRETTLDITAPFVSARERLRDARAEAEGLLRQLATADTATERDAVKAQLRVVRGRIAALRSQVDRLERRADFARVSVAVVTGEQSTVPPLPDEGGWGIDDALGDAGRVLTVAAGVALLLAALAAPALLLAAAAWLARRAYVRRARDAALG